MDGRSCCLREQCGFTISELLLVLGVGAVIMLAAFAGYSAASESRADQANALATTNLALSIKNKWRGIGSYDGVTAASVYNAGLVVKPYSYTPPGPLLNGYGLWTNVFGAGSEFMMLTQIPTAKCRDTVAALDAVAYLIAWGGGLIKDATTPLAGWDGNCGPGAQVLLIAWVK